MKNPNKSPEARGDAAAAPGDIYSRFEALFGRPAAAAASAPGRVNLIGEHIDYAGGTVLPIAINRAARVLVAGNDGERCRLFSREFAAQGICEGDHCKLVPDLPEGWGKYAMGVARALLELACDVPMFDLLVESDVPPAAGLSSSAALEVAAGTAFVAIGNERIQPEQIALAACRAENVFAGVACGIMDQAASALCEAGCALKLRTSDFSFEQIPLPEDAALVIAHSGVSRGLGATSYHARRAELERAAAAMANFTGRARAGLLEYPADEFAAAAARANLFDATALRRARYAFAEQARVEAFARALAAGDLPAAGNLMNESHFGLRDEYEVSCPELDELTARARELPGAFGSRLTGAGFGGCAVTLARAEAAESIAAALEKFLGERLAVAQPLVFETPACGGAELLQARA